MAKKEEPTKPRREGPEVFKDMSDEDVEEVLIRHHAELKAERAELKDDEIEDLAAEEAAIEKEAIRLKKDRERARELAKFTANAVDRMSTSAVTLGLIGPGVGFLYHTSLLATLKDGELVVASLSCLGAAFVLHCVGRAILNEEFQR